MIEQSLTNLIQHFSPKNLTAFFRAKKLRNYAEKYEKLPHLSRDNFSNVERIGFLKFSEVEGLMVYTIKVERDLTERSGKKAQFDFAKEILKQDDNLYDGIFAFYDANGNFRLSLIYVNFYGTRRKLSSFRRFTYYVSASLTNKTFKMRMSEGDFTTLDKIKEAFSVEKVTKEFYQDISNWYDWALKTVTFPSDAIRKENGPEMSVIRLITRMIFIWFMRVKGFISKDLFEETTLRFLIKKFDDGQSSTYYQAILQNLFFAVLSNEVSKRKYRDDRGFRNIRDDYGKPNIFRYKEHFLNNDSYSDLFKNIPFLNGGLFSNLDVRKNAENKFEFFIDGFSDHPDHQARVPNSLFFGDEIQIDLNEEYGTKGKPYKVRGLLKTFEQFNFTIDENTPDDQDIALDPELLGQVFENLLAKVNPETSEAARKETGSFYTPREIVDFMVDESLVAFFETAVQREIPEAIDVEDRLRQLLAYQGELPQLSAQEINILIQSIDSVKILDPACGSGAFPMGMLNKLVFVLGRIDPTNELWKDLQMNKALRELEQAGKKEDPQDRARREEEIEKAFDQRVDSDYGRKLYLIRNAIYGIDIQPMAIQISKLRFFISLIVEQQMDLQHPEQNFGILPLPNLETKFVTANSLIHLYQKPVNIVPKPKVEVTEEVIEQIEGIRDYYRQYLGSSSPYLRDGLQNKAIDLGHKVNRFMKDNPDFEALNVPLLFKEGKTFDDANHYVPLPNLETHAQSELFSDNIRNLKEQLQRIHERHFTASNEKVRNELEKEDTKIREQLQQELIENPALGQNSKKLAALLADWKPFEQNSVAGFFDPEWMFDVKNGFDIVIGNPPYIQLQSYSKTHPELQREYANAGYQVHDSMGDIYGLFYELGYSLLKWRTGILAYITSNKWMRAGYGKKLRDFFNTHTDPIKLIDFAGQRVFSTATVDVNIMIFRKSKLGIVTQAATIKENCLNVLGDYLKHNNQSIQFQKGEIWVILDNLERDIKEKIMAVGTPLSDWEIKINYGIKTGFNEAFIISEEKRYELVDKDSRSANIIRPILRGRDIRKYGFNSPNLWLISLHNGNKSKGITPINVEAFPAIKAHLDEYYERLSKRLDKGVTPYNLRDCSYWEDFFKRKIVYPETTQEARFAIDDDGYLVDKTGFIMISDHCYYLQATLSSKLFEFAYKRLFSSIELGVGGYQYNKHALLKLPVLQTKSVDSEIFKEVEMLAEMASKLSDPDPRDKIDYYMYNLYSLNSTEISFVENYFTEIL